MKQNPTTKNVNIDKLELDPKNPRLPESIDRNEKEMLQYIARETSIEELMAAIGENDYFPGEPLIACETSKHNRFRVIEGNRRLVALRLLQNPEQVPKRKKLLLVAGDAKYKPTDVPVVIFQERNDVLSYLGYRHITGIKQWDPLAKARYMQQIFEVKTNKKANPDERYKKVAKVIGSRRDHVKRTLIALALYNIMEEKDFYGIEELDDQSIAFSLLSTVLGYEQIFEFLGIKEHPPIGDPKINHKHLKELTQWLFEEDDKGNTKLGESRNIKMLSNVVASPKALKEFRRGADLDQAYRQSTGIVEDFEAYLYDAQKALENANATIANVKLEESHQKLIENIFKQARLLNKNASADE